MSGPLQKYRYNSGRGNATVLKLNEADAARLGLGPDDVVDGTEEGGGVQTLSLPDTDPGAKQRPSAQNKGRSNSANKGGRAPRRTAPPVLSGDGQQGTPQDGGDGGPGGGD